METDTKHEEIHEINAFRITSDGAYTIDDWIEMLDFRRKRYDKTKKRMGTIDVEIYLAGVESLKGKD